MTDLTPEYIALKTATQEIEKKLIKLSNKKKKLYEQLAEMHKSCTHEEIELVENYYSGSYYDRASTDYWHKCKLCGKSSKIKTVVHSWYG